LEKIFKHHKEWIAIVKTFGAKDLAEDIVQDTYLRILRLNYVDRFVGEEVNKGYMWMALKSVYVDHLRKIKMQEVPLDYSLKIAYEEINNDEHNAEKIIYDKIDRHIDSWDWYDSMLFRLYKDNNFSLRDIAKKTGISVSSIFLTIKSCKQDLKNKLGEDYEDYLNKDYEWIQKR